MDIENLTIGELKALVRQLPGIFGTASPAPAQTPHPFVGRYVLCRCYSAGVHTGELVSLNGDQAILRNSRRLWSWKAQAGVALSGVAQNGMASGCKVDTENSEIALTGVIEVIPCSQAAKESICGYNNERI
jgi:hypothetical protein